MRKLIIPFLLLFAQISYGQQLMRQSFATTINIEVLDNSTFLGKTGIAVSGISCLLKKHSDTTSSASTLFTCAASASTHDCVEDTNGGGIYNVEIPAADNDVLGRLDVYCKCSGTFIKSRHFEVVATVSNDINVNGNASTPDAIWAALTANNNTANSFGALIKANLNDAISNVLHPTTFGNTLDVTATGAAGIDWGNIENPTTTVNLSGTTIQTIGGNVNGNVTGSIGSLSSQAKIDAVFNRGVITGTAQTGSTTSTIKLASGASATDLSYVYWLVALTGGTGAGQVALITNYVGSTKVATVLNQNTTTGLWLTTPDNTTTYALIPFKR